MSALFINPNGGGSVSIDNVTGITADARTFLAGVSKPGSGQNFLTINDSGAAGGIAAGATASGGSVNTYEVNNGIVTAIS